MNVKKKVVVVGVLAVSAFMFSLVLINSEAQSKPKDTAKIDIEFSAGDKNWSDEDLGKFKSDQSRTLLPTPPEGFAADGSSKKELARQTIYQYGGPESAVRCDKMVNWGGLGKHCVAHTLKWKQHRWSIAMFGPADMNAGQLKTIKDACFAAAVSPVLIGSFTIDSISTVLTGKRPVLEATLHSCVEVTEKLGKIVVKDFELKVHEEHFWN